MDTKEKLSSLLTLYRSKKSLCEAISISRPTLDRYLSGAEPESYDTKLRIDFLYFREYGLKSPSESEMGEIEESLLENQYLIDPKEEFVFKDYVKKIVFGSYEMEADEVLNEESFRSIADGGEIEKDISRKTFLEMINLYSLTSKVLKEAAMGKEVDITDEVLRQWHFSLMQGIRSDAGEYSTKQRIIENSSVVPMDPREIPAAILRWVEKSKGVKTLRDIAQSHALLEKIHPFGDGNGRIGRLIVAVQCINAGYVPPLINKTNAAAYYASLEATQLGKKSTALAMFFAEAIRATAAQLPLLPKGIEAARKISSGNFLKYGYNRSFMTMAVCNDVDILESFYEQSNQLRLNSVKKNPAAMNELTLEFAYGSSKMEGSTFSKLDTKKFLEKGLFPDYKYDDDDEDQKEIDKMMAINNKRVIETLLDSTPLISLQTIIDMHDIIVDTIQGQGGEGISNDSRMVYTNNGQYLPVVGSKKIESLLYDVVEKANEIEDPFVKSFFLHLNIAHIQPFDDANKRTARAVANIPLITAGIVPFSYDAISRDSYINQISHFYEFGDSVERFTGAILRSYEKEIEQIKRIIEEVPT